VKEFKLTAEKLIGNRWSSPASRAQ